MILGHAFPPVVEAIERAARNSAALALPRHPRPISPSESSPAIQPSRSSVSSAPALKQPCRPSGLPAPPPIARSSSNSRACYHGHSDGLLVKAGSGVATSASPAPPAFLRKSPASHSPCPTTTSCRRSSIRRPSGGHRGHHSGTGRRPTRLHCSRRRLLARPARHHRPRGRAAHRR